MAIFEENRELLMRFREGEPDALERVYRRYVDDVHRIGRYGFTLTGEKLAYVPGAPDDQTTIDVVQETFARAFSRRARLAYDGLRPYRPYLLKIARNLVLDLHRRQMRKREVGLEDFGKLGACGAGDDPSAAITGTGMLSGFETDRHVDPEAAVQGRRDVADTQRYVQTLDEEMRTYVELRFERELTQMQISAEMGISRRRIRTLDARLKRGLRAFLKAR